MDTKILFEEYRGDLIECIHYGMVCLVDKDGVVASVGDESWYCYYRSCSKPIQSLPIIERGLVKKYGLTEEETAVLSGSHWADPEHVQVLESILKKTGLNEEQMIMLPTYPNRPSEKMRLIREGKPPRKIYHNCSGKHIGMMMLAKEIGEPIEKYWVRGSRTQEEILQNLSILTDVPKDEIRIGVDGCGVPVYAVPFHTIAKSYLRLARPELIRDKKVRDAVTYSMKCIHKYPNMIAGKDVICSVLASNEDLIGKSGAQGVYAMGIRSKGLGIVLKIMDGSQEEFESGIVHILEQIDYDPDVIAKLKAMYSNVILNDNKEKVGYRKAVFNINL